jgi:hypothetical protein
MFYIERLNSTQVHTGTLPWEFKPETQIPDEVRADKKKRHDWLTNPNTRHYIYSFFEGLNPNQRITKCSQSDDGNPPVKMWALIADYDNPQPETSVIKWAETLPFVPNWVEKTLSQNWRYVWVLEKPAGLPSYDFTCHFLKKFPDFGFQVHMGAPGFDKGAWQDPARLFTNSCDWRPLNKVPISKDIVQGWIMRASQSFKWTESESDPEIPLEVVKSELERKFPRFSEWPGEFVLRSQGPSFWVCRYGHRAGDEWRLD